MFVDNRLTHVSFSTGYQKPPVFEWERMFDGEAVDSDRRQSLESFDKRQGESWPLKGIGYTPPATFAQTEVTWGFDYQSNSARNAAEEKVTEQYYSPNAYFELQSRPNVQALSKDFHKSTSI